MVAFISGVQKEIGKEKFTFESKEIDQELFEAIKEYAIDRVKYALDTDDKVEIKATIFLHSSCAFMIASSMVRCV